MFPRTSGTVAFVDATNDDFRIGYSSVCKNSGTSSGAPSVDYVENTRNGDGSGFDMGAYEYVCSSPVAGTAATGDNTICSGTTGSLTVSGETARSIKWQQSPNGSSSWTDVSTGSNYTTNSFTTAGLTATTYYRLAASCNSGDWSDQVNSNVITMTVPTGTKYVATTGSNSNDGNSSGAPYLTLSYALSQSTCGTTINVASGTYQSDYDVSLRTSGGTEHDGISIVGAGRDATIFDNNKASGQQFMKIWGSVTNVTISDLTIREYSESSSGAGLDITTTGSVTIQDVNFHDNTNTSDYDAAANNLIVGTGSGDEGITILSGQSVGHHGSIFFADGTGATNSKRGQIRYEQNSERMKFFTAGTQKLTIDINGKVGIGSDNPQKLLELQHIANRKLQFSYDDNIITMKGANNNGNPETIRLIGGNSIRFHTGTTGSGDEALRIDQNGNSQFGGLTNGGPWIDTNAMNVIDLGSGTMNRGLGWGGTNSNYANIWTEYSSGDLNLATGLRMGHNSGTYVSSYGGSAIGRANIELGLNGIIRFRNAASGTVANGTEVTDLQERLRIETGGDMYHTGGRIFTTRATGEAGVLIGSGNAGGATLYLDGDSNGDWSGGDYAYIRHNTSGNLEIRSTNPNDDGQINFYTGDGGTNYGGIKSDGRLSLTGADNARAIEINPGGNAGTIVLDRNGYITSMIRSSDGGSNVAGGSGGGSRIHLAKNQFYVYTFSYTTSIGDAPTYQERFKIDTSGNFHGSSSNNISDQRLKKDIVTITDPLTKIKGLTGRTFKWKEDSTKFDDKTKYGFIAQEVETSIPELVDSEHGIVFFDKDDKVIYDEDAAVSRSKSVNETGVIPITVEALKVLISKVEILEAKVD